MGGGVAGLAAGVALLEKGIACSVIERDASIDVRAQGYGMTLSSSPQGPLAKLGILAACQALNCSSRCHWLLDARGRVRGYYGRGLGHTSSGEYGSLRVQRSQLRRVLLERFEALGGVVEWGIDTISHDEFDVIVGADGLRSRIRRVGPDLQPVGVSVVVGLSTARSALVDGQGFYVLGDRARLFTMPFDNRRTMWQLSFHDPLYTVDRADLAAALDRALDIVRGWFAFATELIRDTALDDVWASPLFDRDPMHVDASSTSRVTVTGDACHPMTCFKGQGANQALADALTLANCLSNNKGPVHKRLRTFEREMVQRAAPRALASRQAAQDLHAHDASFNPTFPGLDDRQSATLAAELLHRNITATTVDDVSSLERQVRGVIAELGLL